MVGRLSPPGDRRVRMSRPTAFAPGSVVSSAARRRLVAALGFGWVGVAGLGYLWQFREILALLPTLWR